MPNMFRLNGQNLNFPNLSLQRLKSTHPQEMLTVMDPAIPRHKVIYGPPVLLVRNLSRHYFSRAQKQTQNSNHKINAIETVR